MEALSERLSDDFQTANLPESASRGSSEGAVRVKSSGWLHHPDGFSFEDLFGSAKVRAGINANENCTDLGKVCSQHAGR